MGRSRRQRRQQHGSAWHWKQTDCWYYTAPGTKRRVPLFDENGQRIRGKANQEAAETALAKVKVANESESRRHDGASDGWWPRSARNTCNTASEALPAARISEGHRYNAASWLNALCGYCGALPVDQLKKGHIRTWVERHATWRIAGHSAQRAVLTNLPERAGDSL